jgi:hypothetical protein
MVEIKRRSKGRQGEGCIVKVQHNQEEKLVVGTHLGKGEPHGA